MYKVLLCVEKKDYHHLVNESRHYSVSDPNGGYIFNKKGYQAELYKEKKINGINCVIFGWTGYELDKYGYDICGVKIEKEDLKNGYILMEFEDKLMANYKNRSKIPELAQAMNVDKIITKDDFAIAFNEKSKENKKEEEEEFE